MATQELRKDGFDLAVSRYKELKPILDEVKLFLLNPESFSAANHLDIWKHYVLFVRLQLAILEAEQKAEEEEGPESSSLKKRGNKKNKQLASK